eukprot:m.90118 g.90118  ORF g.90118 m.90118 type:complete len:1102 (+) comp9841_c0_seq2:253-3558(+)
MHSGTMFRRECDGRKSPSHHSDRHYRRRMQDKETGDFYPTDGTGSPPRRLSTGGSAGPAVSGSPPSSLVTTGGAGPRILPGSAARKTPRSKSANKALAAVAVGSGRGMTATAHLQQAGLYLGVGIFELDELQVLATLYDRWVPQNKLLTEDNFVRLMKDMGAEPDEKWFRNVYVAFNAERENGLTFREFVRGIAAMDMRAEDTDERIRYIFRAYAGRPPDGRSAAVLYFDQFKWMVRNIRKATGLGDDMDAAEAEATDLFTRSDLDLATGFITESVFVSASLNGSFQGTDVLFRLVINGEPLRQGILVKAASKAAAPVVSITPPPPPPTDVTPIIPHSAVSKSGGEPMATAKSSANGHTPRGNGAPSINQRVDQGVAVGMATEAAPDANVAPTNGNLHPALTTPLPNLTGSPGMTTGQTADNNRTLLDNDDEADVQAAMEEAAQELGLAASVDDGRPNQTADDDVDVVVARQGVANVSLGSAVAVANVVPSAASTSAALPTTTPTTATDADATTLEGTSPGDGTGSAVAAPGGTVNEGSRTNRSSVVNASTTDAMMTRQPAPPHPTPPVAAATAAAGTVPMSTTIARTAPPLPVDTVSGVDTANTVTLGNGAAMVVTTPPRQVGENKGDGRRTQGSSGAVQAGANATAGAAPMVFDEPGDAVEVAAVNNVNSVNNVLMGEFRHASPIPLRMSTPQTPMTGSLEKDQGRTFTVKICREAVFDSVNTQPHPPETTRKVAMLQLASPVKALPVSRDADAVAQRVLDTVLDRQWEPPQNELFGAPPFMLVTEAEMLGLFECAETILLRDPMVVHCAAPARIFGDIHGQLPDLLHFFHTFGLPCHKAGDIHLINYVFVGDFVDRGSYSLEVITLLLCLKIRYPSRVVLIRGNHEDRELNEHFGFRSECEARLSHGERCWSRANDVFDTLPVAALIDDKILCVHGGIGATLQSVDELAAIPRPLQFPVRPGKYQAIMQDVLWSDPTSSDRALGIHHNQRGDDMVEFGPDRVVAFLEANGLDLIVRAHQCVQRGYEFFAGQRLVTLFSATNYCGRHENDGAIMSVSRELEVYFHVLSHRDRRPYSLWSQPQNSTPPRRRKEAKHGLSS